MSTFVALAISALILSAGSANAATTLIGDTLTVQYIEDGTEIVGFGFATTITGATGPSDIIVDAFPGGPFWSMDIEGNEITVRFLRGGRFSGVSFDGPRLSDFDFLIGNVAFAGTVGGGLFDATSVSFNFAGTNFVAGDFLTATVSAVPLPAAGWLLLAGMGGLCVAGRKRGKSA